MKRVYWYIEMDAAAWKPTLDDEFTSIVQAAGGGDEGRRKRSTRARVPDTVEFPQAASVASPPVSPAPQEAKEAKEGAASFTLEERVEACLDELQELVDALAQPHLRQRQRIVAMHAKVEAALRQLLQS